jgi:hypothetical protein
MGGVVSGSANVFRKNVVQGSGTLNIDEGQLAALPPEYADGLKQFTKSVSEQLQSNKVDQTKIEDINRQLDEFVKDLGGVKPDAGVGVLKQKSLNSRFTGLAGKILSALPKTAEVVTAFTPLLPFSRIIGESTQKLVEAIQKEV